MSIILPDTAKIAVIGGGPAGSFFAHFMLTRGARAGREMDVTIFERKSFLDFGPKGCNMCAGALGHHLVEQMRSENIPLPPNVIRQEVEGYMLHVNDREVFLKQGDRPIYTVFRGNSPDSSSEGAVSFDQFLLEHAVSLGAKFRRERITEVIWPEHPLERVQLTAAGGDTIDFDLVAGAFGVNTRLRERFMAGYVPPRTWIACQAEMAVAAAFNEEAYGNRIHVFALGERNIRFVAMTPKRNFITITAIGPSVKMSDLENALRRPEFKPYLPENWRIHCHCHPRFPITSARNPFRDRGVLIGDACMARYLKNGIESAYFTALFAAGTCQKHGIGADDFGRYYRLCKERFGFDNVCGKVLFAVHNTVARRRRLSRAHLMVAEMERTQKHGDRQLLSNSLWSMFTGDERYQDILKDLLWPRVQLSLVSQALQSLFRNNDAWERYADRKLADLRTRAESSNLVLNRGSTVAIIGGGPSGSSCAIRLLARARVRGLPLRVVIFEGKDFDRHYNQCVGVLSPPLEGYLRAQLGIELPEMMIKRRIENYRIYSDNTDVTLDGSADADHTYTVRRVMFDRLLLRKAEEAGAEIVRSRVTGIEFVNTRKLDEVRIYSESQYLRADVVVGAFGLDEAMLDHWERATKPLRPYERPTKLLKTFITKIHTDPAFIESKLGNTIHAFLLSGPRVEFGAVTPKGDHIIVNIAGRDVRSLDLDEFLEHPRVRELLPEYDRDFLNFYAGHFPTSPAKNPYGHRYALVGDATGWMRPFKGKGINTAVVTGMRAADTIFERGFSRKAFDAYAQNCMDLRQHHFYGVSVRYLTKVSRILGLFDSALEAAKSDEELRNIFYLAVSGEASYRDILFRILRPSTLRKLAVSSGVHLLKRIAPARTPA